MSRALSHYRTLAIILTYIQSLVAVVVVVVVVVVAFIFTTLYLEAKGRLMPIR